MPCYLFTYHAYGSWLPDREQGYVERSKGILPQDHALAVEYRNRMVEVEKTFDGELQRAIIAILLASQEKQKFESYYIATEPSHLHLLMGWRDSRRTMEMRSRLKGSLTRSLNEQFGRRRWLSEGGSRRQVDDEQHFDYLINVYLPKHCGWKWCRDRGYFR